MYNKINFKYLIFLISFLSLSGLVSGTTYYVDPLLGDDTWTGTVEDGNFLPIGCADDFDTSDCTNGPLKSLKYSFENILSGGDTLYLKDGVYRLDQDLDIKNMKVYLII